MPFRQNSCLIHLPLDVETSADGAMRASQTAPREMESEAAYDAVCGALDVHIINMQ